MSYLPRHEYADCPYDEDQRDDEGLYEWKPPLIYLLTMLISKSVFV